MNEVRSRRRQRTSRNRDIQSQLTALPPVENPYPPLDILTDDALHRIVDAAFRVLEEMGLEFRSERALKLLAENGASVDKASQMVRMDRELVTRFVGLAPQRFHVHARNPARDTAMGATCINFNTVGSP